MKTLLIFSLLSVLHCVDVIPQPQEVSVSPNVVQVSSVTSSLSAAMGCEEYRIDISKSGRVRIKAGSETGLQYARTTLEQMNSNCSGVHPGRIHDYPRYAWRGFMLDEARHFSGPERVKFILDEMARLKLNVFHWHLTDAQGGRF